MKKQKRETPKKKRSTKRSPAKQLNETRRTAFLMPARLKNLPVVKRFESLTV